MIIRKITYGFVSQKYDTMTDSWISQGFYATGPVNYEDRDGKAIDPAIMGDTEPYLPFDMIQPPVVK